MTGESRSAVCERARVWASLLPDGELSVFERRLLDAHCDRCPECKRLLDDVRLFTAVVRATPQDEMSRPIRVPSARYRSWRPAMSALASGGVAALALVLAIWVGPQARTGGTTTQVVTGPEIILAPTQSSAESKAIWSLKRERVALHETPVAHRTGSVLT